MYRLNKSLFFIKEYQNETKQTIILFLTFEIIMIINFLIAGYYVIIKHLTQ